MIAVDSNVLVYAHRPESPFHSEALAQVSALSEGLAPWAIPWPCVHEFLGVVTRQGVYKPPTPVNIALAQVAFWLESPSLQVLAENSFHFKSLASVLTSSGATGPKVHDARIAALCLSHGVDTILTMDRDFSAFPELKVRTLST